MEEEDDEYQFSHKTIACPTNPLTFKSFFLVIAITTKTYDECKG